ncbi:unnamed protein product [Larinioides sclopetarius]|uniref:Uncharacterized protein n=1 Tax=Larinioides sclopetarius TaxID=280406 RepID=A0AAV1ZLM9_9ARAC
MADMQSLKAEEGESSSTIVVETEEIEPAVAVYMKSLKCLVRVLQNQMMSVNIVKVTWKENIAPSQNQLQMKIT